jgi:hypothetical protein
MNTLTDPMEIAEGVVSGTFHVPASTQAPSPYADAFRLASQIEQMLHEATPSARDAYGVRLARALTRSLIDQLEDLGRPRS